MNAANAIVDLISPGDPERIKWLEHLASLLYVRYELESSTDHLNSALEATQLVLSLTTIDNSHRPTFLRNLASMLGIRFQRFHGDLDLNRALSIAKDLRADTIDANSPHASTICSLLVIKFQRFGNIDDLNQALQLSENLVAITPEGHHDRALYLGNHESIRALYFRHIQASTLESLDSAIKASEKDLFSRQTLEHGISQAQRLDSLAIMLSLRFDKSKEVGDIDRAIELATQAVALTPMSSHTRAIRQGNLSNWHGKRFEVTKDSRDLTCAIETLEEVVKQTIKEADYQSLTNLSCWLVCRYEMTQAIEDIERAVELAEMALVRVPPEHTDRSGCLSNLGSQLVLRYQETGCIEDLERAKGPLEAAIITLNLGNPDRWLISNNLGNIFGNLYMGTGNVDYLDQAIDLISSAVSGGLLFRTKDFMIWMGNLAGWYAHRFQNTWQENDLREALNLASTAANLTQPKHPNYSIQCANLSNVLGLSFQHTGSMKDLDSAVDSAMKSIGSKQDSPIDHSFCLITYASWLGAKFNQTGEIDNLHRAVDHARRALTITPLKHTSRHSKLLKLGILLKDRFRQGQDATDLNDSIEAVEQAVSLIPQDHPDHSSYLSNLGAILGIRYEQAGALEDIERAVELADTASKAVKRQLKESFKMGNLGNLLGLKFQRTGDILELDRAIDISENAIVLMPESHPDRLLCMDSLASLLSARFEVSNTMRDINRAVDLAALVARVEYTGLKHVDRYRRLHNLGTLLGKRFKRSQIPYDLHHAIDATEKALQLVPSDHSHHTLVLVSLAVLLGERYDKTGIIKDINRAIDLSENAVDKVAKNSPHRPLHFNSLAKLIASRFQRVGDLDDLNRSIINATLAIEACPSDHPYRATYLQNLGSLHGMRFMKTNDENEAKKSIGAFVEGWKCIHAPPSLRISLAQRAGNLLAIISHWDAALDILKEAVANLHLVSPRWLSISDKQSTLAEYSGITSLAAAVALNAGRQPIDALQLLEHGRAIITGHLIEIRSDLSELMQEKKHFELAQKFVQLREELNSYPGDESLEIGAYFTKSWRAAASRQREAYNSLMQILTTIRTIPEFRNFHLLPNAQELMSAAISGPVVIINTCHIRSDAFLIEKHQIRVIQLQDLKEDEITQRVRDLRSNSASLYDTLRWLWEVATNPILEALEFRQTPTGDDWAHVWWIPTGKLSNLPLHAAGIHEITSKDTVLDRVISSYSSSIKALIYGRKKKISDLKDEISNAVMVAMPETPGLSQLEFANSEVKMLQDLCDSLKLLPAIPSSTKADVLAHLNNCKIFHFAGHGSSDTQDPSKSKLHLEDWEKNPLTVSDLRISVLDAKSPYLAYLSACSTSENQKDELIDEGIHLVGACQLAGFRHVIGTMWRVSDRHSVNVARMFYETIRDIGMTDDAVCRGLHNALRKLRDKGDESFSTEANTYSADGLVNSYEESNRDATLRQQSQKTPIRISDSQLRWVPYVHFGV